jgi:hypothetical protein
MEYAKDYLQRWRVANYPNWIEYIAKDSGDVCIMMIRHPDRFMTYDMKVLEYNIYYPGDVTTYRLKFDYD